MNLSYAPGTEASREEADEALILAYYQTLILATQETATVAARLRGAVYQMVNVQRATGHEQPVPSYSDASQRLSDGRRNLVDAARAELGAPLDTANGS